MDQILVLQLRRAVGIMARTLVRAKWAFRISNTSTSLGTLRPLPRRSPQSHARNYIHAMISILRMWFCIPWTRRRREWALASIRPMAVFMVLKDVSFWNWEVHRAFLSDPFFNSHFLFAFWWCFRYSLTSVNVKSKFSSRITKICIPLPISSHTCSRLFAPQFWSGYCTPRQVCWRPPCICPIVVSVNVAIEDFMYWLWYRILTMQDKRGHGARNEQVFLKMQEYDPWSIMSKKDISNLAISLLWYTHLVLVFGVNIRTRGRFFEPEAWYLTRSESGV